MFSVYLTVAAVAWHSMSPVSLLLPLSCTFKSEQLAHISAYQPATPRGGQAASGHGPY